MTADTSERGLEELICSALAGHPCEPVPINARAPSCHPPWRRRLGRRQLS